MTEHFPELLGVDIPERPWAKRVDHVEVRLQCDWPKNIPARILRGAVVAAVEDGGGASVAWHNHDDNGDHAQRMPEVLYRTTGGPSLWMVGPRARQHAMTIGARVHALRLPGGEVVPIVGADIRQGATDVGTTSSKIWRRYELLTPLYPTSVAWRRRPRENGPEQWAWAGQLLSSCIESWLVSAGCTPRRSLHVHLHRLSCEAVTWSRPSRDVAEKVVGFRARFVVNANIPDGVGLGQHRSEGFGEVRKCST